MNVKVLVFVSTVIDGRGNRYTFLRDEVGQVRAQIDPLSRRVSFGWDMAGQQRFKLDARLVRISYTHDNEGRQIGRQYPDASRVTQTWDAVSNRTLLHDATGRYTSTFDSLNRVRTVTTPANKKLTYSWDAVSQRRVMIEPEGGRFSYGWDDARRIRFLVNPQDQRTSWTHDAANRVTVQRLGNGSRVSNAYDDANRLLRLANLTSAGATLSSFRDAWDNAGNRTSRVEESGIRVTWSYDNSYQLTRERRSGANSYDVTCTYDQASNRRSTLADGVLTTYTCDAANQLLTTKNVNGTTTLTWDQAGNLATQRTPANAVTTNLWDYDNRLRAVILPSAARYTSTYQGDGQRVQKQEAGSTSKLLWDGQNILLETDNADVTQVIYTLEPALYGNLISQRRSGTTKWYAFDPLGSTDRLIASNEIETDSYLYKAFGEMVASSGSTVNPFQWIGQQGYYYEPSVLLHHVRERWLQSAICRWLSIDPSGFHDGFNLYYYVSNNPANHIDPSGLAWAFFPPPAKTLTPDQQIVWNCCKGNRACQKAALEFFAFLSRECPPLGYWKGVFTLSGRSRCHKWRNACQGNKLDAKARGQLKGIAAADVYWCYYGWRRPMLQIDHSGLEITLPGGCKFFVDNGELGGSDDQIFFAVPAGTYVATGNLDDCVPEPDNGFHPTNVPPTQGGYIESGPGKVKIYY